jgi:hypothetical protein
MVYFNQGEINSGRRISCLRSKDIKTELFKMTVPDPGRLPGGGRAPAPGIDHLKNASKP